MADIEKLYAEFLAKIAEMTYLGAAAAALEWDMETYMPEGGAEARSKVVGYLAGEIHDRAVSPAFEDVVRRLKDEADRCTLDPLRSFLVRRAWIDLERDKKLPGDLVRELADLTTASHLVWVRAKEKADFGLFLPNLKRIVELEREKGRLLDPGGSPYDALLGAFEPGATTASVAAVFQPLRQFLAAFIQRLAASPHQPDPAAARFPAPAELQARLCRLAAETIGFDFQAGRLDVSAHPFTTKFHPGDVRITTRYDEGNFVDALTSVTHEAGHGLYDQGLPAAYHGTAAGEACSYGIHESQSRLWENLVGRGRPFWEHLLPKLRAAGLDARIDLDAFYRSLNLVRPSFIRVEADEVTYNLHICLRFDIERELIEGRLEAADLPAAWNAKFEEYLGLKVPDDAKGVLQDVHWSAGLFGYFPSYALGNLYSAQLFDAARRDLPGLEDGFRRGEFAPLREWLADKVWRHGATLTSTALVRQATGAPPDPAHFISYVEKKYGEIYRL